MTLGGIALAVAALIAITNPLGAVPVFAEITTGEGRRRRWREAATVATSVALILAVSVLAGAPLLHLLGVSVDALRAAGGLVILLMGIEMLGGSTSRLQGHHGGPDSGPTDAQDSLVVPLAMPLIAGPGAIATAITLAARHHTVAGVSEVLLAVLVAALAVLAALAGAEVVTARLDRRGHAILIRFLGLLLASIGAQTMLEGATAVVRAAWG